MLAKDDAARGKWEVILKDLGLSDKTLSGRQTECPICGGKDRFRFDNKEDRGTWYCNKCGAGDGYKIYMHVTGIKNFNEAAKKISGDYAAIVAKQRKEEKDKSELLNKLWRGTVDNIDPIVEYLGLRSIRAWPDGVMGRILRYHPHAPWTDGGTQGYAPAMLARVFNADGTPATIHRTFLTTDVPMRKMLMPHKGKLSGCYIPLGKPVANHLGVAEGIETALAAHAIFGIPAWATYCADQLERFVEPKGVDILSIYGDNDTTFVGQAAAYKSAMRAAKRGLQTEVHIPIEPGMDWNDVLMMQEPSNVRLSSDPATGSSAT